MIFITGALVAALVLLILALYRQQVTHLNHISLIEVEAKAERKSLLDRIQHPTIRQVEPVQRVEYVPPEDAAQFAMVGQWDGTPPDLDAPMPDMTDMLSRQLSG